jgi:hypothetical protein
MQFESRIYIELGQVEDRVANENQTKAIIDINFSPLADLINSN